MNNIYIIKNSSSSTDIGKSLLPGQADAASPVGKTVLTTAPFGKESNNSVEKNYLLSKVFHRLEIQFQSIAIHPLGLIMLKRPYLSICTWKKSYTPSDLELILPAQWQHWVYSHEVYSLRTFHHTRQDQPISYFNKNDEQFIIVPGPFSDLAGSTLSFLWCIRNKIFW